jgi:hypothetical protein
MLAAQWRIARDALRAWRGAAARARLRGQVAGFLTWPRLVGRRRAIQRTRRVSLEYLEELLQGGDVKPANPANPADPAENAGRSTGNAGRGSGNAGRDSGSAGWSTDSDVRRGMLAEQGQEGGQEQGSQR